MTKVRPLRTREELEKQLQTQIALGVITSIEDAERANNEDALEYSAQMMFDDVRIRISNRSNLPLPIIYHLSKDRNIKVRCSIIKQYFDVYTDEMKENFYKEVDNMYKTLNGSSPHSSTDKTIYWTIINIMEKMVHAKKDETLAKLLKRFGHREGVCPNWITGAEPELRDMPKTVNMIYDHTQFHHRAQYPLALMHPNSEIRKEVVKKILSMRIDDLRTTFSAFGRHATKRLLYEFIATDPSSTVRRFLVNNMNHINTLQFMSDNDPDKLIKCRAKIKLLQVKKRVAYSKKYRENKK